MAFRAECRRDMASTQGFHNWNLVADDRLEVDVLRRPVRMAPWSDVIRMRFVRQCKDWKFDEVEWLNRRIEPADSAPQEGRSPAGSGEAAPPPTPLACQIQGESPQISRRGLDLASRFGASAHEIPLAIECPPSLRRQGSHHQSS